MARLPRRVGVYGGTFNPIHVGHLILAEQIRERMVLDRVLFVPSGTPPHKPGHVPTGADRLAMVRMAIRGNPAFAARDLEVRREGRSYTIETLLALGGPDAELYFLIGMDAFAEIATWHEADRLPGLAHFVVFPRVGHPLVDPRRLAPDSWRLGPLRRTRALPAFHQSAAGGRVLLIESELLSVSASSIRARVSRGASIRYLVPAAVERYIAGRGLYGKRMSNR